jgi:hypothetical protein
MGDLLVNRALAVGLPGVLGSIAPSGVGLAVLIVGLSMPWLATAPARQAYAGAPLVGLAASVHALAWDAALLVPFWMWAMTGGLREPARTRAVVACYALGPLWLASRFAPVGVLAAVVALAWAGWWLLSLAGSRAATRFGYRIATLHWAPRPPPPV